jgi:hypothetical protein
MIEAKAEQEGWLRYIVDVVAAAEGFRPTPYWLEGDFPPWVQNAGRELTKALNPTAKLKVGARWEPGEVGAMLGQKLAYLHWFIEWLNADEEKERSVPMEELQTVFGKDIEERTQEFFRQFAEDFVPAFSEALRTALGLAAQQDFAPLSRFFASFSRGLEQKRKMSGGIGRTNTVIYVVLLTSWRRVEELGSIPALHRKLRECLFLGPHVVGDLKRVEKICERIGLSYREIAERKARAINPDMSA